MLQQKGRTSSNRTYYSYDWLLDARHYLVIWFDGDPEGVEMTPAGKIIAFKAFDDLASYCHANGLAPLVDDGAQLNLDSIAAWCKRPSEDSVDCRLFLDASNAFTDVARSDKAVNCTFIGDADLYIPVYDKLFWGCNLPAVTPPGQRCTPTWSRQEVSALAHVLRTGLDDIRSRLMT